ncbi:MAG: hypothetical protein K5849_05070 [Bacteroidales bacterium]|nr:hypothetical protein [Bacteroidales bacterium]
MRRFFSIALSFAAALTVLGGCSTRKTVADKAGINTSSILNGGIKTYTFYNLPENVDQLKQLPEANMKDPYGVAALVMAALCRYETNPEDCFEMLNWLKGPDDLSTYERQFIRERLQGKAYKPRSFFQGATPDNNYTPKNPYKFTPVSNPYTFQTAGWASIRVQSGGADSPRTIKLRQKGSTGEWFLNEIQCLSDIRTPANENPWY